MSPPVIGIIGGSGLYEIDGLTDLGGRNTLLYYKDRRAGTLDLTDADPDAVERFEKAGHIRLTKLFPADPDVRADAIRRMQAIYRKSRELQEERGIKAGYLATGLARWDELFLEPAAPVLLRPLIIAPTRARYDDFDLTLDDDTEVNPVLLHKLATVFGAGIDRPAPERIAGQLAKAAHDAEVPGTWLCRNGMEGTLIEGGDLVEPKKVKVPRTPWDMLRERRSIEELEELLKERLEIIKSRRRGS